MALRIDDKIAIGIDGTSSPFGLEIMYVDDFSGRAIDRDLEPHFQSKALERAVRRGRDFEALFPRGVLRYVTNSLELAKFYVDHFRAKGLKNYKFTIVPAILVDQ
jgi:hypothetical protein